MVSLLLLIIFFFQVARLVFEEFYEQGDQEKKELHITPIVCIVITFYNYSESILYRKIVNKPLCLSLKCTSLYPATI